MLQSRIPIRAAAIALVTLMTARSDLLAQQRVRAGVTGAVVSSTLDVPDENLDRRTAFAAGATIDIPFSSALSLITGLTYAQKGATSSSDAESITAAFELAYLQIPAVLRVRIPAGKVRPYVEGGGAFAMRLSCRVTASAGGFNFSGNCADTEDENGGTSDPIGKTDVSAIAGAGMDFGKWAAGLRYDHGLTNLDKTGTGTVKNRAFLLNVTYWLGR